VERGKEKEKKNVLDVTVSVAVTHLPVHTGGGTPPGLVRMGIPVGTDGLPGLRVRTGSLAGAAALEDDICQFSFCITGL